MKNLNIFTSFNGDINERNWCCGAKRVTVETEDTNCKGLVLLKSIPMEVTGISISLYSYNLLMTECNQVGRKNESHVRNWKHMRVISYIANSFFIMTCFRLLFLK